MNINRKQRLMEMLEVAPSDSFLRYALCMEHIAEGQTIEAIDGLHQLLIDDPEYAAAYYHLSLKLAENGRLDEAKIIANRGLEVTKRKNETHANKELRSLLNQIEDIE